jgi:inhibitor of KinA
MKDFRIAPLGDSSLSLEFEDRIDPEINARCVAIASALAAEDREGIRDVVPGFHTVAVHFDVRLVSRDQVSARLEQLAVMQVTGPAEENSLVEIPISYGHEMGPDLAAVAAFANCSEQEVVRIHMGRVYRVYMLGFLPGFAYLGSVDRRIAMPRLDAPRPRVEAGSVGIAGEQTAIYPSDSPGGWRIIGRTTIRPFDPNAAEPFLFKAGQSVRFVAV